MKPKTNLYELLYVSQISEKINIIKELEKIQQKSNFNNKKSEITGILICLEDTFVQVLEGDRTAVLETFQKISADDRHHNVKIIEQGNIIDRSFEKWNIGILNLTIRDELLKIGFENSKLLMNKIKKESSIRFLLSSIFSNKDLIVK